MRFLKIIATSGRVDGNDFQFRPLFTVISCFVKKLFATYLKDMGYPFQNITRQKVTVDNIEGAREAGTAMGQMDTEKFAMPGLPDDTKVVIYSFYAHGITYTAHYTQQVEEPDILRDFELMVTKTLRFSN